MIKVDRCEIWLNGHEEIIAAELVSLLMLLHTHTASGCIVSSFAGISAK